MAEVSSTEVTGHRLGTDETTLQWIWLLDENYRVHPKTQVDYHLAPSVKSTPSYMYIKDTTDLLIKLEELPNLPANASLVTLDVKSFYSNVPHDNGILACREMLYTRDTLFPPSKDILRLIEMILTKNNFTFNEQHCLQSHRTAMGTRIALSYANLFMDKLKRDACTNSKKTNSLVKILRSRFRDMTTWT